ncbi:hypothetical protein [Curtobacterium sp. VKM Ac-1393]|nr:hypothetical protein [Curtobacterium sp. VKM Ac-1393]MBF4607804.1 hypothetical protein [Curtobacterium sp. VKM Ac-1393]
MVGADRARADDPEGLVALGQAEALDVRGSDVPVERVGVVIVHGGVLILE